MKSKKQLDKEIFECDEYFKDLTKEEQVWITKFYKEYYYADYYSSTKSVNPEKYKKEDTRRSNSKWRDAMGKYNEIGVTSTGSENLKDIKGVSQNQNEYGWETDFKIGGTRLATHAITKQALKDLENPHIDKTTTLIRYYIKMDKLRRHKRKKQ